MKDKLKKIRIWKNKYKAIKNFNQSKVVLDNVPIFSYIETTNMCNLHCAFCPRETVKRKQGLMKKEDFEAIVKKVHPYMLSASLFYHGEPLLNKNLPYFVSLLNKYGIKSAITTNALALTEDMSRKLLKSKLYNIHFSFDGINKEIYEKIRRGSNFEIVQKNILDFLRLKRELKSKVRVIIRITEMNLTRDKIPAFIKKWSSMPGVDYVQIDPLHDWAGQIDSKQFVQNLNKKIVRESSYCILPWLGMDILYNGDVFPCCMYEGEPYGNILTDDIKNIWNNKRFVNLRKMILKGKNNVPFCKDCTLNSAGDYFSGKQDKYFPFSLNTLKIISGVAKRKVKLNKPALFSKEIKNV
ncbi:MAG: radical SAM protein [archaeon]